DTERWNYTLHQNNVVDHEWWTFTWFGARGDRIPDDTDRPMGSKTDGGRGIFPPNVIVINHSIAGNMPGAVPLRYIDSGAHGDYTIHLSVRRSDIQAAVDSGANTANLGKVWTVTENGWQGTWTRRGQSMIFDAVWKSDSGVIQDVLQVQSVRGFQVILRRRGNGGTYTGTVSPDSKTVQGTASSYAPRQY